MNSEEFVRRNWADVRDDDFVVSLVADGQSVFSGTGFYGKWDSAAEFIGRRLYEIRQVTEEITELIFARREWDGDSSAAADMFALYTRILDREQRVLTELKRGMLAESLAEVA